MFGSLGVPELLLIFVVILIVFGPRRIPEIGRTLGKALGEFRKATDDLKSTIEREVRLEELKKIAPPTLESFMTPSEAVSRTEPYVEETVPPASTTIAQADATVAQTDATAPDSAPADVTPVDAAPVAADVEPGK
jgi:TatA/E family protein of Tat protein translocase